MLQKLPKSSGDSVILGTVVAIGITPSEDKKTFNRFASFVLNGELISYEIHDSMMHRVLSNGVISAGETCPESRVARNDYRYSVEDHGRGIHGFLYDGTDTILLETSV